MNMRTYIWIPNPIKREVSIRDKGICTYCGKKATSATLDRWKIPKYKDEKGIPFELDHKIPLSKKGETSVENIVLSCRSCNRRRNRLPDNQVSDANELVNNINSGSGSL